MFTSGAASLVAHIKKQNETDARSRRLLIAHSHGDNVALQALQRLEPIHRELDRLRARVGTGAYRGTATKKAAAAKRWTAKKISAKRGASKRSGAKKSARREGRAVARLSCRLAGASQVLGEILESGRRRVFGRAPLT